jgi:hypothetical protein
MGQEAIPVSGRSTHVPPDVSQGALLERAERALVSLIALHSLVVGIFLVFATEWGARLGGFAAVTPLFFARQGGAFHFVAAAVYLIEYFRYRGLLLLVLTKSIAVVFLAATSLLTDVPWVVPLSGLADGAMVVLVLWLRRRRGLPIAGPEARP